VHLILASTSARRRQLLTAAGYRFDINPVYVDETQLDGESPRAYVARVAADKARDGGASDAVSLGADTVVVDDGAVLGKPADAIVAAEMLSALSGGTHDVLSGWACSRAGEILAWGLEVTEVTFRPLAADEIAAYIATGEPLDRAGAYAIQGGAGAFVAAIDGSYTNVMGLPMEAVSAALADLGIEPVAVV
jgi:septum formation protein